MGPGKFFAIGWRAPRGRALLTLLLQVDWSAAAPDIDWGLELRTGVLSLVRLPLPWSFGQGTGFFSPLYVCKHIHILGRSVSVGLSGAQSGIYRR